MDQEMKVKIDELMKAHGVHELNLDEMEKVSGGSQSVNMNDVDISREQFDTMFLTLAETCGFDTAISMFSQSCGVFECVEMTRFYTWDGRYSDRDKMGLILYKYWQFMETGKVY